MSKKESFTLPEGDPAAGKQVFVALQCNSCHSLPDVAQMTDSKSGVSIALGGEVRNIKTYPELVTSVINPSHKILQGFSPRHKTTGGESAMRSYNDVMTVTQLIDLVSFLQTQYRLKEFDRSQYRAHFPS
ncbi:MAG: c-type cytochrome [Gammaproteobacteria bacterium]|nr:c-type cytochrome [Gammaproteobacteria bacterium]MBT8151795.1 c-type cytochrome [Gammaproteobacteria bacterium]NND39032.1 c-type cytochrome [Pseudomonadales bacterium]NNL11397.1 c-type cytochrome [Pseudomonadales bacterium]NNM11433.1 c-type cytochrome [Pseudomonadales bacterium]